MSDKNNTPVREVSIVLGNDPHARPIKEGKIESPGLKLNFTEYEPLNKAFDVMVQELAYDMCEMAVGTFFQALDSGKPLRLVPVVMGGEFHHGSLWFEPANGPLKPEDLAGRRVGVRAYTQTTGIWVRGILQEQYGVSPDKVTWVTSEAPHVAEYTNPPNVELAAGANLAEMVRSGELAAVIIGPKQGTGAGLQCLIPDLDAAIGDWYAKHQTVPVNHMVVVTDDLLKKDPAAVREIYSMLKQAHESNPPPASGSYPSAIRFGVQSVWKPLQLVMQYAVEQKLISRVFDKNEVFAQMIDFD